MIAQLTGIIADKDLTEAVIDCNGIGFAVSIPLSTTDALPPVGAKTTLLTTMTVREDDIHLYGFATPQERKLFNLLTGAVSGIGPRLALNVLSSMSVQNFANAISGGDIKLLSKISGVGKKTAERMVVELRDKVPTIATGAASAAPGVRNAAAPAVADAEAALETLGFKHDQAEKAVLKIVDATGPNASAEEYIRKALALLNA